MPDGVAGFNLRGCPMRMRRLHAMTLRLGIAARDESRYSAEMTQFQYF